MVIATKTGQKTNNGFLVMAMGSKHFFVLVHLGIHYHFTPYFYNASLFFVGQLFGECIYHLLFFLLIFTRLGKFKGL